MPAKPARMERLSTISTAGRELCEWIHRMGGRSEHRTMRGAVVLAGGAKDEQVARLLGISLRTARRITANLAELADTTSHFELGVAAAKRGWA